MLLLFDVQQDRGDEFTYTGSGGRDLSGNKRIGEHSFDQTLTHMNRYSNWIHQTPFTDSMYYEYQFQCSKESLVATLV